MTFKVGEMKRWTCKLEGVFKKSILHTRVFSSIRWMVLNIGEMVPVDLSVQMMLIAWMFKYAILRTRALKDYPEDDF